MEDPKNTKNTKDNKKEKESLELKDELTVEELSEEDVEGISGGDAYAVTVSTMG